MKSRRLSVLFATSMVVGLVFGTGVSNAAVFNDPTWPCIQRKVEKLSLGLMWEGAQEVPDQHSVKLGRDAESLADRLALRKLSIEEAEGIVTEFVAAHPGTDRDSLGTVFERVFRELGAKRSKIINGIGRYSLKQIALSEKIEALRTEMDDLLGQTSPDYDKIDKLEEQLDWEERIYKERSKSLTYVCETPVRIEKRLYSIAKILMNAVPQN